MKVRWSFWKFAGKRGTL